MQQVAQRVYFQAVDQCAVRGPLRFFYFSFFVHRQSLWSARSSHVISLGQFREVLRERFGSVATDRLSSQHWYAQPMKTWIALIRGINVGGRNRLPMKSLAAIFKAAGCKSVKTYIQSGNVVFNARLNSVNKFADAIGKAIETQHGFRPAIQLITTDALKKAITANPYPQAAPEPKSLHLCFLKKPPLKEQVRDAEHLLSASESFAVIGSFLYLHAPEGIARSRFAKGIDKAFQMNATARNWRTVTKLAQLAATIE
ncbi:MAG: DUF1697 domain-containing protein [Woeseiaceae bacterium]